jgi:nucleoid-associated protein YgaU
MEKPVKAKIVNLDNKEEIDCLFNPSEYTFSKNNTWAAETAKGKNVPLLEFGGGSSMQLKMQLFFDTYTDGGDVRETTNKIWKLMRIDESLKGYSSGKGRPPMVEFQWGRTWSFQAVLTQISQKFTLFRYDGTPVRATLDVTFMQVKEEGSYPGQNPTSVVIPGHKRRIVKDGDTIDWIAFEEYGDASQWRFIAETNDLDNPQKLRPGQVISIAPLS